jgi:hypothetical protein
LASHHPVPTRALSLAAESAANGSVTETKTSRVVQDFPAYPVPLVRPRRCIRPGVQRPKHPPPRCRAGPALRHLSRPGSPPRRPWEAQHFCDTHTHTPHPVTSPRSALPTQPCRLHAGGAGSREVGQALTGNLVAWQRRAHTCIHTRGCYSPRTPVQHLSCSAAGRQRFAAGPVQPVGPCACTGRCVRCCRVLCEWSRPLRAASRPPR